MEAANRRPSRRRRVKEVMAKTALWAFVTACVLWTVGYTAFQVSPWPSALLVRYAFEAGSVEMSALARHVPSDVAVLPNEHYAPSDDAYLDVYFPSRIRDGQTLPTVVWVHGGGWVSGNKDDIANYAKILAGKGYTVVAVNYSIAPGAIYPTPLRQLAAALTYLDSNAERLHVDRSQIFLAGDSAGAQIVAQVANIISVPTYAATVGIAAPIERSQLAGTILYCGAYDIALADLGGRYGGLVKTMLWAYTGQRDFMHDPDLATASVVRYVTADFPPAFISAGNADPLESQSRELAATLTRLGVPVDSLFFPDDYRPALPHEYQFDLDTAAGRLALARSVAFLSARTRQTPSEARTAL